jgi:hypothetical protein
LPLGTLLVQQVIEQLLILCDVIRELDYHYL